MKENPPIAPALARRCRGGTWALTVPVCPFCGKTHHHGGGDEDAPSFGVRVTHCGNPHAAPKSYALVPESVGVQHGL